MSAKQQPAALSYTTTEVEHSVDTGAGELDRTAFHVELSREDGERALHLKCNLTRLGGTFATPSVALEEFTVTLSSRSELAGLVDALSKALQACDSECQSAAA